MPVPEGSVAIYADRVVAQDQLRKYVEGRGWTCARVYQPAEWPEMIADAANDKFAFVVALRDGLWWVAAVLAREKTMGELLPRLLNPKQGAKGRLGIEDGAFAERATALI